MIQIGAPAATIDSPIDHLMACHRRIEQRLDTLLNAAAHMETGRAEALAAIARSLAFMDTSGVRHTEDEEESLFPRLRPKLAAEDVAFLDSLEAQHQEAEAIYTQLKQLAAELDTSSEPDLIARYSAAAESLRRLYLAHIQIEDEILTALARRALDPNEIAEIAEEMRHRRA